MKNFFLLITLILFTFNSCNKSDDGTIDEDIPENLAELIIGKWKYPNSTCHGGYIYRTDGTFSWRDFEKDECNTDICGLTPFGGTYTITGDILFSTGGPSQGDNLRGRIEITGDVFNVYDEDTNELITTLLKVPECST